jgi:hypothetical protein
LQAVLKGRIMSQLADWAENAALDWLMGGATPTRPTNRYLALFTTATDDASGGTEMSGGGYARQAITCGAASGGTCSNTNEITFTISGVNPSPFTHAAVFDASTNGNRIWHGALTASKDLGDGDSIVFAAGDLDFTLA